jgi:hypothetical protein
MGGLVLVFGGLIAFTVFQSDQNRESLSQVASEAPAARGPMFEDAQSVTDQMANSNAVSAVANKPAMAQSANASANASNTASNSMAVGADSDKLKKESTREEKAKIALDGVSTADSSGGVAAPPPPAMAAPKGETTEAITDKAAEAESKDDKAKAKSLSTKKAEDLELNSRQVQNPPRTQAGGVAKSTPGPSRNEAQNFPNRANNTLEMYDERRVSGKGFQRRNNVWYDNSYRSQATINVRRGTDEYRKLDGGLRSIAESLDGVVVVMWSGKAYRIQ